VKSGDKKYLEHILENIGKIELSTKGLSLEDFKHNDDLMDATIRRVEIIGEAVKNLSNEIREKNIDIEWKKIAGTRDVLIHAYFDVEVDLLWGIIKEDLSELKGKIKAILNGEKSKEIRE